MARWFLDRSPQKGIPSVSLRRLLPDAEFVGCRDLVVTGCSADTRRLDPGQLYVDVSETGIVRAFELGAVGAVVERAQPGAGRPQIVVGDVRNAYGRICHALAGEPAGALTLIAVAGRRGRRPVARLLRSILESAGHNVGTIGPQGWSTGDRRIPPGAEPPGPEALAAMLGQAADAGCDAVVLELTEADLASESYAGLTFSLTILTDLADPNADTDTACESRRRHSRLARAVRPGGAVIVNAGDAAVELLGGVNLDADRIAYGDGPGSDARVEVHQAGTTEQRLRLFVDGHVIDATLSLAGRAQADHALAAAVVAARLGITPEAIVCGLEAVASVPARLEAMGEVAGASVWLDDAATATELREALGELRPLIPGRLHLLLDIDGSLDDAERLAVAEAGADRIVLSTVDERPADANAAIDAAIGALIRPGRVRAEIDRGRAISEVLAQLAPGDGVLVLTRGLRTRSVTDARSFPIDDRTRIAAAARALAARQRRSA